ncbi:MAG: glycosyltransferase family A protein, partial [Bdellovibrionales bacterium]
MKLSVIVCTRNRGYAIKACLSSVASALKNIEPVKSEIVVVNNASEDDTENIIKNWTETNSTPLNLIYEPRKGLAVARNCGLRHAKGELLAFTDDDCRLAPDYAINILRYDRDDREPVLRGGRVELGDSSDLPFSIRPGLKTERWQKDRYAANLGTLGTSIIEIG